MSAGNISVNQVLAEMIKKQNFLEKALLNSRVKKAIDYGKHGRPDIRCPFEPGDIIAVEPMDKFGVYEVKTNLTPVVIPRQKIHLTSSFSESISELSANPGNITEELEELNLNLDEIGIYKFVPEDFGYRFEVNQPTSIVRFSGKTGSWNLAGADMIDDLNKHNYPALIPEIMVFEDRTPITIKAISTDPNTTANRWVRVSVFGFQIPVKKLEDVQIQRSDPRIVANIWVGTPQK